MVDGLARFVMLGKICRAIKIMRRISEIRSRYVRHHRRELKRSRRIVATIYCERELSQPYKESPLPSSALSLFSQSEAEVLISENSRRN